MPSSVMKFMHGLHLWLQTTPWNQTTKSGLMVCLEALVPQPDVVLSVNVKSVDGALLRMLRHSRIMHSGSFCLTLNTYAARCSLSRHCLGCLP